MTPMTPAIHANDDLMEKYKTINEYKQYLDAHLEYVEELLNSGCEAEDEIEYIVRDVYFSMRKVVDKLRELYPTLSYS